MKSQRKILTAIFILFLLPCYILGQTVPQKGLQSITPEEMKAHVYFLASDEMRGRNTPSPELDSCAVYIAHHFEMDGLKPVGDNQTYFQHFNLLKARLSEPNTLVLSTSQANKSYDIKTDFVPLQFTANRKVTGTIVFAGYGITAPEYDYDDYKNVNTTGKIVFIFDSEPQENDSTSVFAGTEATDHSRLWMKVENALDHGAVGLILVTTPAQRFRRPPNFWPSLMRHPPEDGIPLTLGESSEDKIVCVQIGRYLADDILDETGYSLEDLYSEIDSTLHSHSFEIHGKKVAIETSLQADKLQTQNVVGLLEGTSLKDEYVVIGAHYDHIGARGDSIIYNGADDNASGAAGVMEVADAFAESGIRPKRSVLFITFAGEEKGLFGSRYYVNNPIFPIENTIAMLNMDMISRNDTNEVAIVGALTSPELKALDEEMNKKIGLKLDYGQDRFFSQSDHYSFYRKHIPVLFYFTKPTPDLHQPTDVPEKIIPQKMARIGQLVFSTAWMLANQKEKPSFKQTRKNNLTL